jgi:hypothetical protein
MGMGWCSQLWETNIKVSTRIGLPFPLAMANLDDNSGVGIWFREYGHDATCKD